MILSFLVLQEFAQIMQKYTLNPGTTPSMSALDFPSLKDRIGADTR